MEIHLYRDSRMEQELHNKIHEIANERHGGAVPADVQDRIATEERHIFGNGHGTLLAVAAKLAEFSESRGCPVGFRGLTGNLYLSHLLGLAAVDPMELGLRWEGCLGLDGTRAPMFTLNVAGGLLEEMAAYLGELLPGYDPDAERPAIRLCPHALMDRVWEAWQAGGVPAVGDVLSDGSMVARAYQDDVASIPVLGDLDGFQDLARRLEPETFSDLVKIMGLALAPEIRFQAERLMGQPDRFQRLVGTREDVYYWGVEGDISKCFDHIGHSILLKRLYHMGVKDRRVLQIIKAMLKAGVMDECEVNEEGTPQGGLISPLLANVYLDIMDEWVSKQWETKRTQYQYRKPQDKAPLKKTALIPGYLVRYADDFVIVTDTRAHAESWKSRLQTFLREKNEADIIPGKNADNRCPKEVHQVSWL